MNTVEDVRSFNTDSIALVSTRSLYLGERGMCVTAGGGNVVSSALSTHLIKSAAPAALVAVKTPSFVTV